MQHPEGVARGPRFVAYHWAVILATPFLLPSPTDKKTEVDMKDFAAFNSCFLEIIGRAKANTVGANK